VVKLDPWLFSFHPAGVSDGKQPSAAQHPLKNTIILLTNNPKLLVLPLENAAPWEVTATGY
jgi:hypothetical protein